MKKPFVSSENIMSFIKLLRSNSWSIQTKLVVLAMISATVAVAITGVSMARKEIEDLRTAKVERLSSQARMLAVNSAGVLRIFDQEAAEKLLLSLESEPTVELACLYDIEGNLFASYVAEGKAKANALIAPATCFNKYDEEGKVEICQEITDQEHFLGTVVLRANSTDVARKLHAGINTLLIVALFSLAIAVLLSGFLQRNISDPIFQLALTANAIAESGDYSLRVEKCSGDEIGQLGDAFNKMLSQVEGTKRELLEAHDELEDRVEQRTAELQEASRFNNAILEATPDAIVVMDKAGRIVEWSPKAVSVFGWEPSEVLGRRVSEIIIPQELRQSHEDGLKRFLDTGVSHVLNQRIEITAIRRDGNEFPIELALVSISDGEHKKFCGFIRDVTERREVEESMREAKEAAETANCSKSAFLANMSHEIRTPLNGILGFTDLLIRDEKATAEERLDFLQTIQSSGKHLLELINDILDLSKIEAGQYDVEILACQPHQIIAEVVSFLRVPAQEKGLELNCRWEGLAPATIQTDAGRLKQVLTNLVGNAVKFTEQGRVDIIARLEDVGHNPQFVVSIVDTGIGIAQEKLDEIFNPFSQADNTVTRRFGGTGLGLTICRQIAEALGGSVLVESVKGEGSIFTLKVPTGSLDGVEMVNLSTSDGLGRRKEKAVAKDFDLAGVELLLVEDGSTNRKLISLALRRVGVNVTEAEDGKIGSDLALAGSFDMILMDMQMPVMDGYTAARLLRDKNLTLPIIALTAHAMKGDEKKCQDAGCSGYLTKPVDIDALIETVATATGRGEKSESDDSTSGTQSTSAMVTKKKAVVRGPVYSSLPTEDEDFREIVSEYIPRMQANVEEMIEAVHQSEWTKAAEIAHWLKGAGGTAGFSEFTEPTQQVCENIEREQYTSLESLLEEIQELSSLAAIRPLASELPTTC